MGRTCEPLAGTEEFALRKTVKWIDRLKAGQLGSASHRTTSWRPSDGFVAYVFDAYQTLRTALEKSIRGGSKSRADKTATRKSNRHAMALYAWRCFWEGDDQGRAHDKADVPMAVAARFLAIFPEDSESTVGPEVGLLLAGAGQGTFFELWRMARDAGDLDEARCLGTRLAGTFVPFFVAQPVESRPASEQLQGWMGLSAVGLAQMFHATYPRA